MTTEVRRFSVTIPAGTAVSAGFTQDMSFPSRLVSEIRIRIPPGPRGEVGVGIGNSGIITIPFGGGTYIVTDDEDLDFPLTNAVQSGSWTFFGYNTGTYNHTIQVYFSCDPIPSAPAGPQSALPITDTGSTGTSIPGIGGTGIPGGCTDTNGNVVDCPPGTPAGTVIPAGSVPVLPPPPTLTAPTLPSAPVTLPPITTLPPGLGGPAPYSTNDPLLLAVPDLGQVWILDDESYRMVADQDGADALLAAGIAAVSVSTSVHQGILALTVSNVSVALGPEPLSGALVYGH